MKKAILLLAVILFLAFPPLAFAGSCGKLSGPGCECAANAPAADVPSIGCFAPIVSNVINIALTFAGAVTLLFLLWGALQFVISRGDPKALQNAQKTMTYAVIGIVVVLGSFFIINIFTTAFSIGNILTTFNIFQGP